MNIDKMVGNGAVTSVNSKVREWLTEWDEAGKREKEWRKTASGLVKLYECGKSREFQFNILYSNTETLAPALYNSLPRPVAQRRFKDEDPLGKVGSQVIQRSLEFLLDNDVGDYTPFDDLIQQAVLEALVPGRGVTWFKYDAAFTKIEESAEKEEIEGGEDTPAHEIAEQVTYETCCGEHVPWERFRHGYAKQWKDVPWVGREHFMTREELVKNFGKDIGATIPLTISGKTAEQAEDEKDDSSTDLQDADGVTLGHILEIWDKDIRKVLFIAPAKPDAFVKSVEDPLKLSGFFPLPRPLNFFMKVSSLVPVPLYQAYEEQAKELNRVTVRINKIISALKVRGFYDSTIDGLEKVMQADDNVLIPAENVAALQQGQTLEKSIWLMPLEKLIAVLQQLYLQRQQIKQVIYEITGISDILRGASVASETATAQNIKNQWGTLRLKRMQKVTQRYVRDCLRIMGEVACTKFSKETLAAMTGLQYPTGEQKAMAMQTLQTAKQQLAGQPPQSIPPQTQQSLMKLQQVASMPSWEDIQGMISNDLQRNYRIDIETNSTVDAEATEDKANMGEFLNAAAQFLNGVGPLVQQGILPFEAAKSILLAVTRRYRFGTEVEDQIREMQAPKPQGTDGTQQAAAEKAKFELESAKAEHALRMEELQMEKKVKDAEMAMKMQELQRKSEFAAAQHVTKMRQFALQQQAAQAQTAAAANPPGITAQ